MNALFCHEPKQQHWLQCPIKHVDKLVEHLCASLWINLFTQCGLITIAKFQILSTASPPVFPLWLWSFKPR
jgi:hypothetical protein